MDQLLLKFSINNDGFENLAGKVGLKTFRMNFESFEKDVIELEVRKLRHALVMTGEVSCGGVEARFG